MTARRPPPGRSDPIGLAAGRLMGHLAGDDSLGGYFGLSVDRDGVRSIDLYSKKTTGKRRASAKLGEEWEGFRVVVHRSAAD